MINNFVAIGRLTKDVEIRTTSNGKSIGTSTLAFDEGKDKSCFIDLKFWEKLAELVSTYSGKGKKIGISGKLTQESWENEGKKYSKHVIVVDNVEFLDSKASSDSDDEEVEEAPKASTSKAKKKNPFEDE